MIWIGGFGWGPGLSGLIITVVMFAVNAFGLYLVVRQLRRRRDEESGASGRPHQPSDGRGWWPDREPTSRSERSEALRILEERYARGEIDREEFLRRRDDILGR